MRPARRHFQLRGRYTNLIGTIFRTLDIQIGQVANFREGVSIKCSGGLNESSQSAAAAAGVIIYIAVKLGCAKGFYNVMLVLPGNFGIAWPYLYIKTTHHIKYNNLVRCLT